MSAPLLATKFYIPPGRAELIARPRLTGRLLAGLGQPRTLILLSGPAGSGKTTLLSAFVADVEQPVAWLSLDEGDNDPRHFWRYLLAACDSARPGVGQAALEVLEAPQVPAEDTIPTMLINELARQEGTLLLVLDDYHLIHNPAIHAGLSFLLEHLPDNLHLAISTRIDPPFPLARYRARHRLLEVRAQDLRFSREEAAEFLNRTMALNLSATDVAALEARTEGWAAGLQLAALSLRGRSDISAFVHSFTGSHLYVAEYLLEEVLRRQPEAVQTFLLRTSILERLGAGLCTAVTGQQEARAVLVDLHRANIFVIPLDDEGRWFRYHHLFADLLRARLAQMLPSAEIAALHGRAATWYEQHGAVAEAVHHALATEDYERVAILVEQEARSLMFGGRAGILRNWLAALPADVLAAHPRLNIYRLWIDLMQGKADPSPQALRENERLLRSLPSSPENEQLQLELMAVLCRFVAFSGDTARAIRLAEEALARLPVSEGALHARAYSALAVAHWLEGRPEQARQARDEALRLARATGNYSLAAHILMVQGIEEVDYGRLRHAARTFRTIVEMGEEAGQEPFFPAGQGYVGLAGVRLEWHELDQAERLLERGIELCRRGGLAGMVTGHTFRARLLQAKGEQEAARATLHLLEHTYQSVNPTVTARQIHFRLALGEVKEAARLAQPWLEWLAGEGPPPALLVGEIVRLTLARLFLARGDVARARQLLAEVERTAAPAGRNGRLLEVHLLRALVDRDEHGGKITSVAVASLERALALAEPEGYMLFFLEDGPDLLPLLQAVARDPEVPGNLQRYAQKVLAAGRGERVPAEALSPGEATGLVEPLTPRELEVLQQIAAGDSNQEIAAKLFITVRTVKKHASNIYGKLGVGNRTAAVARARELALLPADT